MNFNDVFDKFINHLENGNSEAEKLKNEIESLEEELEQLRVEKKTGEVIRRMHNVAVLIEIKKGQINYVR